ncbi:MAG: hypothetical protein RLZZ347_497 [Candidatus Parcubacteria bacterium]|jgi:hypothetical protein
MHQTNNTLVEYLSKQFSISKEDFEKFFHFYNEKFDSYGNEVYEDVRVRLVHLKYFLEGSWWNNRFYFLWKYFHRYEQIIDIGFSVPYLPLYLDKVGRLAELPKLLYIDGNETSKKVSEVILKRLEVTAEYITGDIEDEMLWDAVALQSESSKDTVLCAFETIEHLSHPEIFWNHVKRFSGKDIMLSLPIGPKIPSHHSFFATEQEVESYLSTYIGIKERKVFVGKSEGSSYSIYTCIGAIK